MSKSFVMVFRESLHSRTFTSRKKLGVDKENYLIGFFFPPSHQEQSTTRRSVFLLLNSAGYRLRCLHPVTSYKLYFTLSVYAYMVFNVQH